MRHLLLPLLCLGLSGCAIDGDDNKSKSDSVDPGIVGVLFGSANGEEVEFPMTSMVLKSGEFYAVYGSDTPLGILHGNLKTLRSEGKIDGSLKDIALAADGSRSAILSGEYAPGEGIVGSAIFDSESSLGFLVNYDSSSAQKQELPPVDFYMGGSAFRSADSYPIEVKIQPSGKLLGGDGGGCFFEGNASPAVGGFRVSLTYSGEECAYAGQKFSGVMFLSFDESEGDSGPLLLVALTNSSDTSGVVMALTIIGPVPAPT